MWLSFWSIGCTLLGSTFCFSSSWLRCFRLLGVPGCILDLLGGFILRLFETADSFAQVFSNLRKLFTPEKKHGDGEYNEKFLHSESVHNHSLRE